jgi:hypothetical protein
MRMQHEMNDEFRDKCSIECTNQTISISLFPYEKSLLESLMQSYSLDAGVINDFGMTLNTLAQLFEKVIHCPDHEFFAGRVVLMGLISHTHLLITGGLQSLEAGNGSVWSACFRGLIEVFGAMVLIEERPNTAPNHLDHVKPGKLRAAADRACPGLGGDIDRLNSVVHPGPGAILCASSTVVDTAQREVIFIYGLKKTKNDECREGINCLANISRLILLKAEALSSKNDILSKGKLILSRT